MIKFSWMASDRYATTARLVGAPKTTDGIHKNLSPQNF